LSEIVLIALASAVGLGWVAALWYLRVTAPPAVLNWERLARLRGLSERPPLGERLGQRLGARVPLLAGLQAETDVGRLLAIAGRRSSWGAWMLKTGAQSAITFAALLLVDELTLLADGELAYPPILCLAGAALVAVYAYLRVRSRARARQQRLEQAVADALPHLAVLTYHHRLPVSEALLVFARCQRDKSLQRLLVDATWQELPAALPPLPGRADAGRPESSALLYERIGEALGVPMFTALGGAVRRVTERGLSSQEVLTRLAYSTYSERLVQARVSAAQAKTLIVIPMGLMIVPVLLLIGAPLVATLSGIFGQ
jgi:hypothetical protein